MMNLKMLKKLFVLFVITFLFLLIFNNYGIWTDETYTLNMIKNSYKKILEIENAFDSTTLYYICLKFFLSIFNASNYKEYIFLSRFFSIIPTILTLIIGDRKISKLFNEKCGLYFLLIFFSGNLIHYSFEIRSYSWTILFTTLVFFEFLYVNKFNNRNNWIRLSVFSFLAFLIHKTSVVPLFLIYFYLFIKILIHRDLRKIVYFMLTFFMCLPVVLFTVISNINTPYNTYASGAIGKIFTLNKFKESLIFPFDTGYLYLSLFFCVICLVIFLNYLFSKKCEKKIIYGMFVLPITCIILMLIAYFGNHDYYPKYMLVSLGIFLCAFSIIVYKNKFNKQIIFILVIINITTYFNTFLSENKAKEGFNYFYNYFENEFNSNSLVTDFDYGKYIIEYYDLNNLKDVEITFDYEFKGIKGYYFVRSENRGNYFGNNEYEIVNEFNINNDMFSLCLIE
ncbi:MAG: hypothetical protein MR601_04515 [Erysipelotrichaceae bacterium]|nr:hypothetical protein [Erysipelotrichaceae bacterium]